MHQGVYWDVLSFKKDTRKEILVTDSLSRAQLSEISEIEELSGIIHSVTKSMCLTEESFKFYQETLKNDEQYSRIYKYVANGWPSYHQLYDFKQSVYKLKMKLHFKTIRCF